MGQEELIATIAATTFALLLLSVGFVLFMIFFLRSKRRNIERQKEREFRYINEMAEVRSEIQENTLVSIARELHDNIGQLLTVTKMRVDTLNSAGLDKDKEDLLGLVHNTIEEVKSYSRSLNSDRLVSVGLLSSIRAEMKRVARIEGLEVVSDLPAGLPDLPSDCTVVAFRIFQEFLNNSLKHAEAEHISVSIEAVGQVVVLSMTDDGIGFELNEVEGGASGLLNLQSRARLINAVLDLNSTIGEGTTLELRIPTFTPDVSRSHSR